MLRGLVMRGWCRPVTRKMADVQAVLEERIRKLEFVLGTD